MPIRASDYNHSATLRARAKAARSLMPDAARHQALRRAEDNNAAIAAQAAAERARHTPDANGPREGRTPAPSSASGPAPAAPAAPAPSPSAGGSAPPDMAARMMEALEKYRAMHEAK